MSLVPKHIKNLLPYIAGKPISEVKRELGLRKIIKLASNENPLGPSTYAIDAVENSLTDCHRYPDSSGFYLRNKLANIFNLGIDNVVIGGGSEGIMSVIMRTFLKSDDEIIAAKNSFIGFRVLADASGIKVNWIPMENYHHNLKEMSSKINDKTKVIYLANPDNPTGTYFTKMDFDAFMDAVPDRVIVLLDEAYFEYAIAIDDYPDSMHYRYDNVITLRTFSKIYGLAGFRIGYGFAHHDLIDNLMKVKLPFEPSSLGQVAAFSALDDKDHLQESINSNLNGKKRYEELFKALNIRYIPSVTNFVTIVLDNQENAKNLCHHLLKQGVILRHLVGFGLPNCIRITIGTEKENDIFIEKMKKLEICGIYNR